MRKSYQPARDLIFLLLAGLISALAYLPVMHNTFLSDDYDSLYRIVIEKRIIYREIFRPFIDITFYINYFFSGLDPFGYYLFNIGVHAITVFFLYKAVLLFFKYHEYENALNIALVSACLFMIYPFHNEAVAWLTGRLSSMATLFALASICFALKAEDSSKNHILSLLFYFISICVYEAVVLLPAIIFILTWKRSIRPVRTMKVLSGYLLVLFVFLMMRLILSGNIFGSYGERVIEGDVFILAQKLSKTLGRTLLPPMENSSLLLAFTIAAGLFLGILHFLFYKKNPRQSVGIYGRLLIAFFFAFIIPALFGVSTRTSEGDRLLYFPSVFLCILIPLLIAGLVRTEKLRWIITIFIGACFLFFLEKNNENWKKASAYAREIVSVAKQEPSKKKILINIPEENEGAFILRNGFQKALILYHIDTSQVAVTNYLGRLDYLQLQGNIQPRITDQGIFIFPATEISSEEGKIRVLNTKSNNIVICDRADCQVWFWNKSSMMPIKNEIQ